MCHEKERAQLQKESPPENPAGFLSTPVRL
jgi:hypothetical protein